MEKQEKDIKKKHCRKIKLYRLVFLSILLICLSIFTYTKIYSPQITYNYETPFVPVTLNYNPSDGFNITANAGFNTPVGRFSVDFTESLSRKRTISETVNVGNVIVRKQDLIVVVRNLQRLNREDDVYVIKDGANFSYKTEGNIKTEGREGELIIEMIDETSTFKLTFYDGSIKTEHIQKDNTSTYNISDLGYKEGYYRVTAEKTFFHKTEWYTMNASRTNNYITQGNVVYIEQISRTNTAGYAIFTNDKGENIRGWLIMAHLNLIE